MYCCVLVLTDMYIPVDVSEWIVMKCDTKLCLVFFIEVCKCECVYVMERERERERERHRQTDRQTERQRQR